ncbi:MAG: PD40 domain-containing protein [Saprospiraceae bacterium]|nr:PD40 domain-containing protein [Candidatus Vicinibacter affinis]
MQKIFTFLFCLSSLIMLRAQESRLLRFPTIYGDNVCFTYAGNLYTCSANGGTARRLTDHEGVEIFSKYSPDGSKIAYTAQYDGNSEVYVMPAGGGVPQRVTYTATLNRDDVSDRMGPNNICMGWKDKETIVYRSRWRDFNDWKGQLYTANINGSMPEQLPFPHGGFCSYSPDKKKIAFNRVFREFRTWKRYKGGQADEIWIYDFASKQTTKITDNDAQDIIPMWTGNKVYYVSDRDKRMNIFVYDFTTLQTKKLTDFKDFDVKFPSLGDKAIVFENGGYIYKLNLSNDKVEKISIQINEDFSMGRNKIVSAKDNIFGWDLSSDGNRACFSARGDIFTVPAKNGAIKNLTSSSNAHERDLAWSPDGKYIGYISDATGEDEIYIIPSNGVGAPEQLTQKGKNYKYGMSWSPDGTKIAYSDRNQKLYYVDIKTKKEVVVASSDVFEIRDYNWSPDSKFLAYTNPVRKGNSVINIYSLSDKSTHPVTEPWFDSSNPCFSSDGKYLYFVSQRTFSPSYNNLEWNHAYFDLSKVYMVTLKSTTKNPFAPKSDEVAIRDLSKKEDKKDDKKDDKKADKNSDSTMVSGIDFFGIENRVIEIPGAGGNYFGIQSVDDKIYYFKSSMREPNKLVVYDLKAQKETEISDKARSYTISADSKKMLLNSGGSYYIVDLPSAKVTLETPLNLTDMKTMVDRKAEFKQIYFECWRQMRDFFYDPGMHGVNWEKLRDQYAELLPYVNTRIDLTYIIGELIGELNCGHAYVGGGDYVKADRIPMGLLGGTVTKDKSGYFRIDKIYKSQNWDKNVRAPLTEIGVDAKEGDYITAVEGVSTKNVSNIYSMLIGTANKQITLKINSTASETGAREVTIIPIADEQKLIYYTWVQNNIEKVNKATGGRVGYLHIPNMGPEGLNEFAKYFYAQLYKEGLIIDDRGNGGGNVSPMIIERLKREPVQVTKARNAAPVFEPADQVIGPKVALIDEYSASDGDIFAYRFQKSKLGPVIGKRSWGGVVGIRGTLPIVDGGILNRPEFSRYDVDGKRWEIEGHGVDPDIVVDNDPAKEFMGEDQQLNEAIRYIMDQMKNKQFKEPTPPPFPVK